MTRTKRQIFGNFLCPEFGCGVHSHFITPLGFITLICIFVSLFANGSLKNGANAMEMDPRTSYEKFRAGHEILSVDRSKKVDKKVSRWRRKNLRMIRNSHDFRSKKSVDMEKPVLFGFRVDNKKAVVEFESDGTVSIQPKEDVQLRFFGHLLNQVTSVSLTLSDLTCERVIFQTKNLKQLDNEGRHLSFEAKLDESDKIYHFCLCNDEKSVELAATAIQAESNGTIKTPVILREKAVCWHQGRSALTVIKTKYPEKEYYLPFGLQIVIIATLMIFSGLFSGLNLGLMSLDKTELEILLKVGDPRERQYAKKIYPIRKSGNYLLCTLLLGNVVVNSAISILFDDLTSGIIALVFSSLGIVIFGEIVPQAICSRYGLAVGAYTFWVTRFFMMLTFPLSWPISKLLDKTLGEEVRQVYSRERLLELIRMSKEGQAGNLGTCQEVQIVTGALELSKKTVDDVMTPIHDVFMLSSDVILDPKTVSEIVKSGFTRIPVFDPDDQNTVVNMLNVKDLALLDPEDKIPLRTICQFYRHPVRFVMQDTPLVVMLEEFKKGHYHLAIVQQICSRGESDPIYEAVGLITLEDIIEEIIQAEIRDEFDIIRDSRVKRIKRRETTFAMAAAAAAARAGVSAANADVNPSDVSIFFNQSLDACDISPQLTLAAYQYLSTTLDAFCTEFISENVLQRLIRQNVLRKKVGDISPELYVKGRECNYFVLILEGKCSIIVGESELLFDAGPFCYFGYELLLKITRDIVTRRASGLAPLPLSSSPSHVASGQDAVAGAFSATPRPLSQIDAIPHGVVGPTTVEDPSPPTGLKSPLDVTGKKFTFTPDFTLQCDRQNVVYLKISASGYTKAYRATLIELGHGVDHTTAVTAATTLGNGSLRSIGAVGASAPGSPSSVASGASRRRRMIDAAVLLSLSSDDLFAGVKSAADLVPRGVQRSARASDERLEAGLGAQRATGAVTAASPLTRLIHRTRALTATGASLRGDSSGSLDLRSDSVTTKEEESEDLLKSQE